MYVRIRYECKYYFFIYSMTDDHHIQPKKRAYVWHLPTSLDKCSAFTSPQIMMSLHVDHHCLKNHIEL